MLVGCEGEAAEWRHSLECGIQGKQLMGRLDEVGFDFVMFEVSMGNQEEGEISGSGTQRDLGWR